jgi:hypothetical protein
MSKSKRLLLATILSSLCIAVAGLLLQPSRAKRGPKPPVPPIRANGVEFRVSNRPGAEGIVEAWNAETNGFLWSRRAYFNPKIPFVERDAQWVFIKSMTLSTNRDELVIIDERNRTNFVSIAPPSPVVGLWKSLGVALLALVAVFATKLVRTRTENRKLDE